MWFVSPDGPDFSGLARAFKLPLSTHTETSIGHVRPFASTFYGMAYGLIGW